MRMGEIRFVVVGRSVPKVRMTQKSYWKLAAKLCLEYQQLVAYSLLKATTAQERAAFFVGQKYFRIDLFIYLAAVINTHYTCPFCKRTWKAKPTKKFVVCPGCKAKSSVTYDLPLRRGDKDNYEKSIFDGIQHAVNDIFNDKQVLSGYSEIIATHEVERVEVVITPYVLRIEK